MTKTITHTLRRLVPSVSLLSFNPIFKVIVNSGDLISRAIYPEFRTLPPNHLRIRVGVGNKLFSNQVFYLSYAENFWLYCFANGLIDFSSTIVDIGCGCGRFAHHLRDMRFQNCRFSGKYIGVDIDPEILSWCRKHFDAARFRFLQSTHGSKSYNQSGLDGEYMLPIEDSSMDLVFSTSLFTHLLERELRNYCTEAWRILKPGRSMLMSCFCLEYPPPTLGGRHTFRHAIGNARVESLRVPEAAVAYSESFLAGLAMEVGFSSARIMSGGPGSGVWQATLVAQK